MREQPCREHRRAPSALLGTGAGCPEGTTQGPSGITWAEKWPAIRYCGSVAKPAPGPALTNLGGIINDDRTAAALAIITRAVTLLREQAAAPPMPVKDIRRSGRNHMAKQPAPLGSGEPARSQPPGSGLAPAEDAPERPRLEPIEPPKRASAQPSTRQSRTGRRWDRYDATGAAIIFFLVALWVLHFLLPAPPPTNVP